MSLTKETNEMYEKVRDIYTKGKGLSRAVDAYARAYFNELPLTGEWTEETMLRELDMLLWELVGGGIDLRRRSAESILRERLKDARYRLERAEQGWKRVSREYENMRSFIGRFHLEELYEEHLKSIRTGVFDLHPPGKELPFE